MTNISSSSSISSTPMNDLELMGLSVDEWIKLSPEEQKEKMKAVFGTESGDELQETLNTVVDDAKEEIKDLKQLELKLRAEKRNNKDLSSAEKEELTNWINKLDEIEADLNDYQKLATTTANEVKKHNLDYSEGGNINVSKSTLKLDGETYTYKIGNSSGNPFGNDTSDNPLKGITSDGTENGTAIKDANGDTASDYDDIQYAKDKFKEDEIKNSQKIFINTPADQKWELASADSTSGTYTFKVTDKKGASSYVTFENAQKATFIFKSGISESDLNGIKDKWPTELLKHTYWDTDKKSFDERFNPQEVTQDTKNRAIAGYSQVVDGLSNTDQYANYSKPPVQSYAKDALEKLYAANSAPGLITEAWNKLFQEWNSKGLSSEDQKSIIKHLIFDMALHGKTNFANIFDGNAKMLQAKLSPNEDSGSDNTNGYSKSAYLLLESLCTTGATTYGGIDNAMAKLFDNVNKDSGLLNKGLWTDMAENKIASEVYAQVMPALGIDTPEILQTIIKEHQEEVRSNKDEFNSKLTKILNDSAASTDMGNNALKYKGWENFVNIVSANIFDAKGQLKNDAWTNIINSLDVIIYGDNGGGKKKKDNAISDLILAINNQMSASFKQAFFEKFASNALSWLNANGNKNDTNIMAARDVLLQYA